MRPHSRTGHRIGSAVWLWVRVSYFLSDFCCVNVMEAKKACSVKSGSVGLILDRNSSLRLKQMLPIVNNFVFPRCFTVEYSQLRMAKKYPARARSAMQASNVERSMSPWILVANSHMKRRWRGVIAFCLFLSGSI